MFEKLPIPKKYILALGILLLAILSYNFALKKTFEAWQQHQQLKAQLNNSTNLSMQPGYLIRKRDNLDSVLFMYKADTAAFRSNTLSKIAIIAEEENVRLNEVPPDDSILHTDKFMLQRLDFEGDFFSLTRVLNDLQAVNNIGLIRSVGYQAPKKNNSTDQKLTMEIYFEMVNQ